MFVNFFIKRPIFAAVISITIVLAGVVCIPILPVAQFPEIEPPTVNVSATYTGASADVVEETVTSPIEEQVNGVEGMIYMSSTSSNDGSTNINVTFETDYNLKIAAVDVQNRVTTALPQVPEDVRRYGVTTEKKSTNLVLTVNISSTNKDYDGLFISNYAAINIVDVLKRIPGVGDVTIMGERKYSMRFWLDPDKLASMKLTSNDVVDAIRDQNIQVAAGSIGEPPSPKGQVFQYSITTKGRLSEPKEFENIIVRTNDDGAVVYMKDVGRIEMGAENYKWFTTLNGKESMTIGVYQLPGANSVDVAKQIRKTMEDLSKTFPKGIIYEIPYDTTLFVTESIKEVISTLFIAIFLVFLVIYVFLQDWRSTVIPAITIPVSLIGTFGLLMAFGFSINTLTLFGLVLAIGTVVDDSIVVVENVSRLIEEEKLPAKEATMRAMKEVIGPIIATTFVLFAVLVPVAFMPGISGKLYKQFSLTIACAVGISSINAMTLSPALCAIVLRTKPKSYGFFFTKFNEVFEWFSKKYHWLVDLFIKKRKIIIIGFLALLAFTYYMLRTLPTGFVPSEDQGYFFVMVYGPEGASLERTGKIATQVEKIAMSIPGIENVIVVGGYNIVSSVLDPSSASIIVTLEPWSKRKTKALSLNGIMQRINFETSKLRDALIFSFNPPPIEGLSTTGGFDFELQDRGDHSLVELYNVAQKMIEAAKTKRELTPLSTSFAVNYPQYYIDLDRTKAKTLGIPITDVFDALQAYLGALYVNDFNKYGRVYRVFVQAEKNYRAKKKDITKIYVRNNDGEMVPISALAQIREIRGPQSIWHYNIYRTAEINGAAAPGYSSGQAINAMEDLATEVLPDGFGYEWTGVALEEIKSAGMAPFIYGLALAFVFLFLAAQYESWSMPMMVMLAVPLAVLGALVALFIRGLDNDVYCQIGLVMLIGLASKNAILIVEFARVKRDEGLSIVEAALTASRIRLRPILMTAFSFIFGVIPLVIATGAGAASRHSLGTTVFGGMIASTFLSLALVPILYVIIEGIREHGISKDVVGSIKKQIKKLKEKK
jgi:hydrophobe/amphiphile efflux-1 (HAE1) family protein